MAMELVCVIVQPEVKGNFLLPGNLRYYVLGLSVFPEFVSLGGEAQDQGDMRVSGCIVVWCSCLCACACMSVCIGRMYLFEID